jgi:hypothetical protein
MKLGRLRVRWRWIDGLRNGGVWIPLGRIVLDDDGRPLVCKWKLAR